VASADRDPTRRRWSDRIGPILARVRLHAIEPRDDQRLIAKRRRWFAAWLIGPGNLYLRWLGSGVRVLPDRAWQARERAVNRRLYGVESEVDPRGWLILPRWPGVVLAVYAADVRWPPGDRLRAVSAASHALRHLHHLDDPWPEGGSRRLSHGDATSRNVIFDPETSRARWFDFDTAHDPIVPAPSRHADDLRALLYSAVEVMADLPVPDVFEAVVGAYDDPDPWHRLRLDLAGGSLHGSTFQLAQAAPSRERREHLERLIRRGD